MKIKKAVFFDFDGTILDSVRERAYNGVCAVFKAGNLPPPELPDYYANFCAPYAKFFSDRGVNFSENKIYEIYHASARPEEAGIFSDAKPVLKKLAEAGVICALITGQQKAVVEKHCALSGIAKFFKEIMCDAEHKVAPIRFLKAKLVPTFGIIRNEVWYVGDFASDMRDAREAKVTAVGITRGAPTREILLSAGAEHCITDLPELLPIVL